MSPLFTKMKGSLMLGYVKFFKSVKDERMPSYLTDQDRQVLAERILQSSWYPAETARHVIRALFEVAGKENPDAARQWGRFSAQSIVPTTYKSFIKPGDPSETLKSFRRIILTFVDVEGFQVEEEKPGLLRARIADPGDDPIFIPFVHMLAGFIEGLVEIAGAQDINCSVKKDEDAKNKNLIIQATYR